MCRNCFQKRKDGKRGRTPGASEKNENHRPRSEREL